MDVCPSPPRSLCMCKQTGSDDTVSLLHAFLLLPVVWARPRIGVQSFGPHQAITCLFSLVDEEEEEEWGKASSSSSSRERIYCRVEKRSQAAVVQRSSQLIYEHLACFPFIADDHHPNTRCLLLLPLVALHQKGRAGQGRAGRAGVVHDARDIG